MRVSAYSPQSSITEACCRSAAQLSDLSSHPLHPHFPRFLHLHFTSGPLSISFLMDQLQVSKQDSKQRLDV